MQKQEFESPRAAAVEIKNVARVFGAGLAGITGYDQRWEYARLYSDLSLQSKPQQISSKLDNVVMVAQPMNHDFLQSLPSALGGAATGLGYSHDALVVLSLAQYIRNLGYMAIASMNDSSLAIPYAIQAGLGEYSRLGLLITREFGPRVRLGKVYTDLPLADDQPVYFGVRDFCGRCRRCSDACPVKAIPDDGPSSRVYNRSNIKGVQKWTVDAERCFSYWAAQNSDCAICLRVCPYNKDYSHWYHRLGRTLAGTMLRRNMLWLDKHLGYGKRLSPSDWWDRT